jgi:thioesterase domain-containing protein/acyl carrier protein
MPHGKLGEDVGAAVTLQDGQTVTERALRNFVAARLADFKVPRRILFLPELPKGATGKPQRIGLAERLGIIDEPIPQPEIAPEDAMPQTKTELRVAACWMRTLKREAISLHANFFDIGGDSLAALTLVADLEREMGVLIEVMEHPTIAAMAAVLEEGGEQASQRLYSIKAQGARPPLFLIGAGPLFRNLSLRLDPEQPVLSAVLLDYSRMPVPCRVEDIAAFHVETIRSVQQHGPYALGGWCIDSIVAYEAARQLRALGEEVELLILFEPLAPQGFVAGGKWSWLIRRTLFHLGQLRALDGPQARQYALDRWHTVWRKITRRLIQLRYRIGLRPSDPSKTYIPAETYIRNALAIQHLAGARYRPGPYDGRTLILRSVEKVTAEGDLSGTKWAQSISGPIETHLTSGHHRSMFLPPEVDQTADLVESSLRAARNRGCG